MFGEGIWVTQLTGNMAGGQGRRSYSINIIIITFPTQASPLHP